MSWYNTSFNRQNDHFSLDSFIYRPVLEKDSFIARQVYQTDYISFRTGNINGGPVNLDDYTRNNKLKIGTVMIDQFLFTDYKDKGLPFNPGILKPLPVGLLKRIPLQFSIDTIGFTRSGVEYTEKSEKTKQSATIPITRMNARFTNVKNHSFDSRDSLGISASGYLLDSIWLRLKVKESYTDSLDGFLVVFQMGPADLRILNPILVPIAMARIESGKLDTLSMRAVGREYLSLGEMKMYYHDLKVALLKDGNKKKGFLSALANLLIKKKNDSRTGHVFFIRQRDRSAINYLVRIAMSGVTSSIGVKSNRKMIRRYKKELEERQLPDIDL
jgi:hypothetical protein